MSMTIEQMKAAIAKQEQEDKATALEMKAARNAAKDKAEELHRDYIAFCKEKGIPVTGGKGRPKGSKNKETKEGIKQ